jgi:hypothetical protein
MLQAYHPWQEKRVWGCPPILNSPKIGGYRGLKRDPLKTSNKFRLQNEEYAQPLNLEHSDILQSLGINIWNSSPIEKKVY